MTITIEPEDGKNFYVDRDSTGVVRDGGETRQGLNVFVGHRYDNGPDRMPSSAAFTIHFEDEADAVRMAKEILLRMGESL